MKWGLTGTWDHLKPGTLSVSRNQSPHERGWPRRSSMGSKMLESGRKSFYDGGLSSMNFYNGLTGDIQAVPFDEKHIRIAALKEDKKNIVKKYGCEPH